MSDEYYAEFWNQLPGPGDWKLSDFSLAPRGLELWDGVRIVAAKRLGDAWTLEQADEHTLLLRRKERPLLIRLRRFPRTPDRPYEVAAVLLVPDEKALAYSVGAEFFREAFDERLGAKLHIVSNLDILNRDDEGEPRLTDCKLILNIHIPDVPDSGDLQMFSCWLVWAVLALEWAVETIEANPNP
jgi:hypothetical protein